MASFCLFLYFQISRSSLSRARKIPQGTRPPVRRGIRKIPETFVSDFEGTEPPSGADAEITFIPIEVGSLS